jgi:hypothetical protein
MSVTPTYPGVYIQEIPSGIRTIAGVPTSITAFVGRALRGPTDEPRRISNWGEFERLYGGLWRESTMSYAVQHYFLNGGVDALICRLAHTTDDPAGAEPATSARTTVPAVQTLTLRATEAGAGGNDLRVTIAHGAEAGTFDVTVTRAADGIDETTGGVDIADLEAGDAIGAHLVVEGEVPVVRPNEVEDTALTGGVAAVPATVTIGDMVLTATTAGAAGNALTARVDNATDEDPAHFDLTITDTGTGATQIYQDVSLTDPDWPNNPVLSPDPAAAPLAEVTNLPTARPALTAEAESFEEGADALAASAQLDFSRGMMALIAANEGEWGDRLFVTIDTDTSDSHDAQRFNLTIEERNDQGEVVASEVFRNVSVDPMSPRSVVTVLEEQSSMVRVDGAPSAVRPNATTVPFQFDGGDDGPALAIADYSGSRDLKTGIYLLEHADLFNLLCIPPRTFVEGEDTNAAIWTAAQAYCVERRAMLIVDAPSGWATAQQAVDGMTVDEMTNDGLGLQGAQAINSAVFFPRVRIADPLQEYRLSDFAPCGVVAGIIARTDAQRGVWKAPAGLEASAAGVRELRVKLTDREHGRLNPLGLNVLRSFPVVGNVIWGSRTTRGADRLASEWKYLPVRRLALFLEESLYRGTQWVVFEPNDEPLWSQIRLNITAFMHDLFRQGAFQGSSPKEAYLVKCDSETTIQEDINRGIVNIVVGFAPLKPAEFVILKITQLAGRDGA